MQDDLIDPSVPPSGTGCVECLQGGGWWLHLRRCAKCGHIGCCDTSPSRTRDAARPEFLATASSEASNPGRIGFGITPRTSSSKVRHWRILNTTQPISPRLDQRAAFPATGRVTFIKADDGSKRDEGRQVARMPRILDPRSSSPSHPLCRPRHCGGWKWKKATSPGVPVWSPTAESAPVLKQIIPSPATAEEWLESSDPPRSSGETSSPLRRLLKPCFQ